ncbi:uncharacterized protein LOC122516966 isoform X2 [Polistes fuscatus]|uniref:uncharacterized protein LOC122516966 isoform X2 n=1 Tax=Polistes fuscatus TaxID=30207 RepID=UPI001CA92B82|nr:uncharacterized protein LOC122516966 isoform X2 [Polistes fuscatus]
MLFKWKIHTFNVSTLQQLEPCTTLQDVTATVIDVCTVCRKEKIPQTDIFQYYNVYKDNEGRVYCDLCAPPYSDKVYIYIYNNNNIKTQRIMILLTNHFIQEPIIADRSEDILQQCSICGNFPYIIDARSIGVVTKDDEKPTYCMKCGQLQS